jgi:hypothetical protein
MTEHNPRDMDRVVTTVLFGSGVYGIKTVERGLTWWLGGEEDCSGCV